jgi:hypothetical protein
LNLGWHCRRDQNRAWPSVDTIGKEEGLSERTVRRALRRLQNRKLIAVERPGSGFRVTTVYALGIPGYPVTVNGFWDEQEDQYPVNDDTNTRSSATQYPVNLSNYPVTVTPERGKKGEVKGNSKPRAAHAVEKVRGELLCEGENLDRLIAEVGRQRGGRLSRKQATAARAIVRDRLAADWTVERIVAALVAATVITTNGVDFADGQLRRKGRSKTAERLGDFLARHKDEA